MVALLVLAMVWLSLALAWYLVFWFQSGRPINDTDERCTWMDQTLRHQHGSGPRWVR